MYMYISVLTVLHSGKGKGTCNNYYWTYFILIRGTVRCNINYNKYNSDLPALRRSLSIDIHVHVEFVM